MKIIVIPDNLNDNQVRVYEGEDSKVKDLMDTLVAGGGKEVPQVWPNPDKTAYEITHSFGNQNHRPAKLDVTITHSNPTYYQIGGFLWCSG